MIEVRLGVCLDDSFLVGSTKVFVYASVVVLDLLVIYFNLVGVRVVVVFELELVIEVSEGVMES